jgi:uridine kinase
MILVGIDGVDGAGKSTLADELAEGIASTGATIVRASIDLFHRPRRERYTLGRNSPDGFYLDSHNLHAFTSCLLEPARLGRPFCSAVFDEPSDTPIDKTWITPVNGGVIVIDGLFLHRPELVDAWDLSIWVDALERVNSERARRVAADAPPTGPELLIHLIIWWGRLVRYVDGFDGYVRAHSPDRRATIVFDNNDLFHPHISANRTLPKM